MQLANGKKTRAARAAICLLNMAPWAGSDLPFKHGTVGTVGGHEARGVDLPS